MLRFYEIKPGLIHELSGKWVEIVQPKDNTKNPNQIGVIYIGNSEYEFSAEEFPKEEVRLRKFLFGNPGWGTGEILKEGTT